MIARRERRILRVHALDEAASPDRQGHRLDRPSPAARVRAMTRSSGPTDQSPYHSGLPSVDSMRGHGGSRFPTIQRHPLAGKGRGGAVCSTRCPTRPVQPRHPSRLSRLTGRSRRSCRAMPTTPAVTSRSGRLTEPIRQAYRAPAAGHRAFGEAVRFKDRAPQHADSCMSCPLFGHNITSWPNNNRCPEGCAARRTATSLTTVPSRCGLLQRRQRWVRPHGTDGPRTSSPAQRERGCLRMLHRPAGPRPSLGGRPSGPVLGHFRRTYPPPARSR